MHPPEHPSLIEKQELADKGDPFNIPTPLDHLPEPSGAELSQITVEPLPEDAVLEREVLNDPVLLYFREAARTPLLSQEEEVSLAQRIERGREASERLKRSTGSSEQNQALQMQMQDGLLARNHLLEANLRLVVSVAKKYMNKGLDFLDLIQEGNFGLFKATEKFDYTRGNRFSTYATWWIRQTVTRAIYDQSRTIRIPVHTVEKLRKLAREKRKLTQELGRQPTMKELSLNADWLKPEEVRAISEAISRDQRLDPELEQRWKRATRKVRELLQSTQETASLDSSKGPEEQGMLAYFIEDESDSEPEAAVTQTMLEKDVQETLLHLDERERMILEMRFGLLDGNAYTLEEVGQHYKLTRERIRQIEAKALRKLRNPLVNRKLREYL